MRNQIAATLFIAAAISGCTASSGKNSTETNIAQDQKLRDLLPGVPIVYSANLNGEIEPCGCRGNPTGGIDRRWNLEKQKISGERLSIDSGDLFYKSTPVPPFLEKQWNYQAEVLAEAYRKLGVEVLAPGELDFAAGLNQFKKLIEISQLKVVSANLVHRGTEKPAFQRYLILTKGKTKVGIFGLYDESLSLPQELDVTDKYKAAKEVVSELRHQVDVVIALTHLGYENDQALAREVKGIDAIFGAHTQSFLSVPLKMGDTLIFQPSFRGQHLGVFEKGENGLYQLDTRFDSTPGKTSEIDKLLADAKKQINRLNKETEAELMEDTSGPKVQNHPEFQTFAQCAQCHSDQFKFHQKTPHFKAFETLVKAKQAGNLDCLKCHTVGMQQPGGWKNVNQLVINKAGKAIDAESFAKSLPNATPQSLAKISKSYINVQCETCHSAGGEHPFSVSYPKAVSTSTCLKCHTPDQAPSWYKGGKPDEKIIQAKLKSMTCPATKQ